MYLLPFPGEKTISSINGFVEIDLRHVQDLRHTVVLPAEFGRNQAVKTYAGFSRIDSKGLMHFRRNAYNKFATILTVC